MSPMTTKTTSRVQDGRGESRTYQRIVREVMATLSAREVAEAVGVGERTVQNWAAGATRPQDDARDALLDLHYAIEALSDVYTPEGVQTILHGRSKALGGRHPLEVFAAGEREAVVELAASRRDYGG